MSVTFFTGFPFKWQATFVFIKCLTLGRLVEVTTHVTTTLAALVAALSIGFPAYAQEAVAVTVNGEPVEFAGQPPVQQGGRVLVPLRGVLEKIGATVRFSGPTKTVQATRGDTRIALALGEREANVDGRRVRLDVPAQAFKGTTMVPLRFVAEALGADVRFDGAARVVAIRTDGQPNVVKAPTRRAGTARPEARANARTFTGIFVEIASQDDATISLKMTEGRSLTLLKNATLLYNGKAIGFDDLRSGDKVVATLDSSGRGVRAVISDDEG